MTWVYFLRHKSEVYRVFRKWKAAVENETGRRLKTLRSDNGGEYTSTEFREYLERCGIRHETTVPKTPEQNGKAERMNGTIMESVRAMLRDSDMAKKFWAEAVRTAVYIRNRCPTSSLPEITPMEVWTGWKPDVSHLRVFGCPAYAHVPRDERGKLSPKTKKCWMLGYGDTTKAYRLYDKDRQRILYSRERTGDGRRYQVRTRVTTQKFFQEKNMCQLITMQQDDHQRRNHFATTPRKLHVGRMSSDSVQQALPGGRRGQSISQIGSVNGQIWRQ
jgi:hypothetical protein